MRAGIRRPKGVVEGEEAPFLSLREAAAQATTRFAGKPFAVSQATRFLISCLPRLVIPFHPSLSPFCSSSSAREESEREVSSDDRASSAGETGFP